MSADITPPPPQLTQQELESWLWKAADILRGPVDPANLRDFILPLLFLKRLSDTWDEEFVKAKADWGDDLTPEVEVNYHRFDIPKGCHWKDLRKLPENQGVAIQKITQKIEEANPELLDEIFGNAPWADPSRMPPERLQRLIEHFSRYAISSAEVPNDLLGGGYEYLLKKFADESVASAGQFFTPRSVVQLLVKILAPRDTDTIHDPACGSAGMLIEAVNEIKRSGKSTSRMRFYGQEINQTSSAIARMNLYIHDVDDAKILRGDTLRKPLFVDSQGKLDQFDVVIANPPFSLKEWGHEGWANDPHRRSDYGGVPPKNSGDFAWVQHMVASAKDTTGRVGVVMPHGVLFRSGAVGKIRQSFIEADLLGTVIGLGPKLFYNTDISVCLLVLHKNKDTEDRGKVRIIDCSQRFQKATNQNILDEDDVAAIFSAYQSADFIDDNIKQITVDIGEIKANGWDLSIGRYIQQEEAGIVDVKELLTDLRQAQKQLAEVQKAMDVRLKAAGYA